jgi:hypothetical protein
MKRCHSYGDGVNSTCQVTIVSQESASQKDNRARTAGEPHPGLAFPDVLTMCIPFVYAVVFFNPVAVGDSSLSAYCHNPIHGSHDFCKVRIRGVCPDPYDVLLQIRRILQVPIMTRRAGSARSRLLRPSVCAEVTSQDLHERIRLPVSGSLYSAFQ